MSSARPCGKPRVTALVALTDEIETRVRHHPRERWGSQVEIEASVARRLGIVAEDVALAAWACRHRLGLIEGSRGT